MVGIERKQFMEGEMKLRRKPIHGEWVLNQSFYMNNALKLVKMRNASIV